MRYFIHRIDKNPGDLWSSPRHYFKFDNFKSIDILDHVQLKTIPFGAQCIVGGGGLIKDTFMPSLKYLFSKKCKIVFWGIGERLNQDLANGWLSPKSKKCVNPNFFNPILHLSSMRSLEPGIEWIPCASCNHPIFDRDIKTSGNGIKILQHKRVSIPNPRKYPLILNDPLKIEEFIEFIASTSILITNSYHAMYWAYLMSVPTICIPFSSGHYSFCDNMIYSTPDLIEEKIEIIKNSDAINAKKQSDQSKYRIKMHRVKARSFYSKAISFLA